VQSDVGDQFEVVPQIAVVQKGEMWILGAAIPHNHLQHRQAGMLHARVGVQQDTIDPTEYRSTDGNTQGQRQRGDRCNGGVAAQNTQSIAQILPDGSHMKLSIANWIPTVIR
jgi:hypothetical protein